MRPIIVLAAVSFAAALIVPRYVKQTVATRPPPAAMAARPMTPMAAEEYTPADSRTVVVPRNAQGNFQVAGRVDGHRLTFMVDTGASVIALTAGDAAALGIHPAERDFVAQVKTANGIVRAAPIRLDMVEIEDLTVRNVTAIVLPKGALSDNLLGLSFLSRLRRFEYSDGKLVLQQ